MYRSFELLRKCPKISTEVENVSKFLIEFKKFSKCSTKVGKIFKNFNWNWKHFHKCQLKLRKFSTEITSIFDGANSFWVEHFVSFTWEQLFCNLSGVHFLYCFRNLVRIFKNVHLELQIFVVMSRVWVFSDRHTTSFQFLQQIGTVSDR